MCLGIPMKVVDIKEDSQGTVELNGVKREVSFSFLEDIKPGDFVLIHAGFAIQKISEHDAADTLKLLEELDLDDKF